MPEQLNTTNIPSNRVEFIDSRTGLVSREWYRFFLNLFTLAGNGGNQTSLDDLQVGPPPLPVSEGGGGAGTVTSVGMSVPTGLSVAGSPVTTSGTFAVTYTAGYSLPTTANQTNWNTAYADRLKWDGGATDLVAATGRTSLGATTVGGNFFTLSNPSAITFVQINADNSITTMDAPTFRTAIGVGTGTGTVLSVDMTVPTGLAVSGNPITTSGTLAVTFASGYSIPTNASQTNWDSAYTQRLQWDGGTTNLVAATGRTSLGGTTVGSNMFTLTNPSAITFPRFNADNTVSALDAATFRTAIGAGTGSGTVTSVTGTSPVASSGGATPAISLASGYGDTQNPYASKSANQVLAAPNGVAGVPTFRAIVAADIPTLNQNTTGTASNVTGIVAVANGGSGFTTAQGAINTFAGAVTSGSYLRGNGTNVVMATIQAADVPTLNQNTTGTASNVTGTVAIANGGTGQTTQAAAITALTGTQTSGSYLRSNGTNAVLSTIQAADVPTLNQNTTGTASNVTGTVAIANGGTGATTAATARTNLGATTLGGNLYTITNPSAVTFPRFNADNTVSSLDAATFRTAIGAGTGSGTVTSVTGTSPVVSSGGATPAISLASGYGDTQNPYASKTANTFLAAPNGVAGVPTFRAVVAADIPTLNQNTTGTASNVTGTVAIANGGTGATTAAAALTALGAYPASNPNGYTSNTGTVTSVAALTLGTTGTDLSSTVATGTTTPVITLNVPTASATNRGALSAADWTTFNSKGSGTVTAVSVVSANGFAGSSSGGATPALTLSTSITGVLKGNGTALSAATAGTDYSAGTSALATGILKSTTTTGALTIAVAADFPTLNQNTTGTASNVTGTVAIANGGTGATTRQDAMDALAGSVTSGQYLRGNGTDVVMSAIQAADVPTLNQNTTGTASNVTGTVAVANGGTGATTAATARTNLGATTVGGNMFTLTNPSAITFPRFNADNTVSALDAATFRTAIGAGTSSTTGTVTSVGGTGTVSGLTLTGTVTTSGNLTLGGTLAVTASNFASQTANTFLAAPNGVAGNPTFRAMVAADVPTLNQNTTGTASNVTGTVAIANGGTGATTRQDAMDALAGAVTSGQYLRGNGTDVVMSAIQAADVPTLNQNTTGTASNVTGTVAIANGGTGATTRQDAIDALAGAVTSGQYLRGNGTDVVMSAIQAADVPTLNQNTTGTASNVTGTVAIANGGTGQTTAAAGFNALAPVTSTGDLIIGNGVNSSTRLAIGTNGFVLTSNGTTATWSAASGGGATITNDTTTATNVYPLFAAATSGTLSTAYTSNAKYLYKPSTGELTVPVQISSNGIQVNSNTVSTSYTITTGNNGMSAGPVSVSSGVVVTISSGSTWTIV